ncbi:MAG: phosphoserine phosphatase SerB [Hyphomicrobiaceae bacterium]
MSHTLAFALVLTAPPDAGALGSTEIMAARGALAGETVLDEAWLGEGEAWEALLARPEDADHCALSERVADALVGRPVDVNVVAADLASRRKKLLVADMDSTIIGQECIDEMGDVLGIKARIAAITERAMRGELDFEGALRERMALLAGLTEDDLQAIFETRITITPGARALIETMRANGAFTALVSGGFTFFTSRVAKAVGFDVDRANVLEVSGGRLTGRVAEPILGREAKLAALRGFAAERGLDPALTLAVGDGANDLAMIGAAGLGVAFRAKPVVAAEADAGITHGDLTALLYLQGYRKAEIVRRA